MNSDDDLSLESFKSETMEFHNSKDVSETTFLTQLKEGDCNATSEAEPWLNQSKNKVMSNK